MNAKQERFCLEYVRDMNATQAAIRAGYSKKTARSQASQLLTKLNIQERVSHLKKSYVEEAEFQIKDWVNEHLKIIRANPTEALESTGVGFVFKDINDIPDEFKDSVKKISFKKGIGMEIELYNKQVSLDAIGKYLGAYEKDNTQKPKDLTFNIQVVKNELE